MALIALDTYNDIAIFVDSAGGRFQTQVEDDTVVSTTLGELHEQLDRIETQRQAAARKAQKPVPAIVLLQQRPDRYRLQPCAILGIHAGRTNRKALRSLIGGNKESLDIGYYDAHLIALHPCDPRAATVQAHLKAVEEAEARLYAAEVAFKDLRATLPSVYVPTVETKEVALQAEPDFLAALQAALDAGLRLGQDAPQA